ncbi:GNAT family N-acetyltransferase [uncultured Roseobacter sp.]|uniref:GNAT family N-acetyltransferase n=1 Tax=uncultured Roseobacter sp. TaxID=114847 RepID=UPI002605FDE4|nr:GNAT family N-acetyltransferase [uncultured Roseobacter sp.]
MKSPSEVHVVRPLTQQDAEALINLYNDLTFGPKTARMHDVLAVIAHPGTTIYGAVAEGVVLGMATLHILPNVTWDGRPYALIENVATTESQRNRGIGRQVMQAAIDGAWHQNAYKIMLMTGKKRGARGFYEALGFDCEDKFGMVLRRP